MEDDVNFESGRSFISISLPARTSLAIRLAGDIPVGFGFREAETVLVLAAEDTDVVLRAIERTESAEEPGGIVVTTRRSRVHSAAKAWRCGDGWKLG